MPKFHIDFLGKRRIMYGVSIVLIIVSIGALSLRGLKFGVEFQGGTVVSVSNSGDVSTEQMRQAFEGVGVSNPEVQTSTVGGVKGFIVRTAETDNVKASQDASKVAEVTKLSGNDFQVTTIGPGWGASVTSKALLALAVSIMAILLYVALRFEYKMSVTAVLALAHDILITLGIYALVGLEVSPNTIAALLTILGYSLYDTIVVFHRIKENSHGLVKESFMSMANRSINQVFMRSINTTVTSLIPVVVLLLFGGATLKDFAFALTIGLFAGAYSSIGIAAPIYVVWKEREPKFAALAKKYLKTS
ncbi:MAG: protein translocase subunit SecF [Coriobacteriia bacterium]|nr:protein translocase subunit SecF [Coriobacteriia bacterium]